MSDTDKSELPMRDYRQYVSWQVVSLLRSLKVANDLTPLQMKLVESKADLMAATIKEDVTQQCNQARIDTLEKVKAMRITPDVRKEIDDRIAELQAQAKEQA